MLVASVFQLQLVFYAHFLLFAIPACIASCVLLFSNLVVALVVALRLDLIKMIIVFGI